MSLATAGLSGGGGKRPPARRTRHTRPQTANRALRPCPPISLAHSKAMVSIPFPMKKSFWIKGSSRKVASASFSIRASRSSTQKTEVLTMARFQQELSGGLGDFWQRQAEAELERIKANLDSGEITIDEAGVARNCIGRALMDDLLEKLLLVTDKADSAATQAAREAEVRATGRRGGLPAPRKWPRCGPRSVRVPRWWMFSPVRRFSSDRLPKSQTSGNLPQTKKPPRRPKPAREALLPPRPLFPGLQAGISGVDVNFCQGPPRPPGGCWRAPAELLWRRFWKVPPRAHPGPPPRRF